MVTTYRCTKLEVTPRKAEFATDENVMLDVAGHVERRNPDIIDISVNWFADVYLDKITSGSKVGTKTFIHAPWTTIDKEDFTIPINLGKQSAGTYTGKIIIACAG